MKSQLSVWIQSHRLFPTLILLAEHCGLILGHPRSSLSAGDKPRQLETDLALRRDVWTTLLKVKVNH